MDSRSLPVRRSAALVALFLSFALLVFSPAGAQSSLAESAGLTVHEWGTFTVVVGPDGVPARWRPLHATSDLPEFVETRKHNGKTEVIGTVRMETPVIYVYSDREVKLSIAVDFPTGRITEWYPFADVSANATTIAWNDIRVSPGSDENYPVIAQPSHYYAARATDASPLVVHSPDGKIQREKMLFYRGVGTFDLPLSATLDAGNVILEAKGRGPSHAIVVECEGGRVGFSEIDLSSGSGSTLRPRIVDGGTNALRSVLTARLEAAGLFPREAAAMLATWGDTWIEDGLRVFFVVPRPTTDELLPLRVTPHPDTVERVLLGRIEFVTPEMEADVSAIARQLAGPLGNRPAARARLDALGHFAEPIVKIVARRDTTVSVGRALRDAVPDLFREY